MKLADCRVYRIEKALGFKLFDYQKNILKGNSDFIPGGRRVGRTLIKMLAELTNPDKSEEPIRLRVNNNWSSWYRQEMFVLKIKLEKQGIPCRKIIVNADYLG